MSNDTNLPTPFPIREKDGQWEVAFVDEGAVEYHVICEAADHAMAIANSRPFSRAQETNQPCDLVSVRNTQKALDHYGLSATKIYHRIKLLLKHLTKNPAH